jgi:hypothetical protein
MSGNDHHWQTGLIVVLLLALLGAGSWYGWAHFRPGQTDTASNGLADQHRTLLADPSSVRGNWAHTMNPLVANVQGDLVWNNQQQQGVMRLSNLPGLSAGDSYQLWIYDAHKPTDDPISGAVLHQGSGTGEMFSAVKATTPVLEPYKFVLKLESARVGSVGQILLMVQP